MRLYKSNFWLRIVFVCLSISLAFGCQKQSIPISANQLNANASANSNVANQSNVETITPAPQTIKFESADKVEIVGTFYESPKANSPAVLLLHQWGSDRKSYDEFARKIQAKGFGVLAIDGRGFGDSVKTTDGETYQIERGDVARGDETVKGMKADVDNAFQFLTKQKNVDVNRMGIVGASYGSSLAMIYGAENRQVKAVALLSPGLNYFGGLPIEDAVKKYGNRSLLLVAAEDDKESAETVKKLAAVSGVGSEFKIYKSGGHGTQLFAAKVGLEDLLERFLTRNLLERLLTKNL